MRDLLHPVLLGLLVTAIGVIAHLGGRAAAKHAGQLHVDDEDTAGNGAPDEEIVGNDSRAENAGGKGGANESMPRKYGTERQATVTDADHPPDA
ncbi:MAG: hypothetical protein ROZ37_09905 [Aromatoleum sp.]|jgi:hypothetical protein|uniref:hypothetical protein n=1 Tax=Aromatoleum sp. TaxID=2307007 RepID=UPI0028941058|nr:hypothetical protein [Aromatoleum sp.]MDT3670634.1 hypothetical protein [Aromatoleum sp.]